MTRQSEDGARLVVCIDEVQCTTCRSTQNPNYWEAPMLHVPLTRAVPHSSSGRQLDPAAPTFPTGLAGFPFSTSGLPTSGI